MRLPSVDARPRTAFVASEPFLFFDYFRVPYDVVEIAGEQVARIRSAGHEDAPSLAWTRHTDRGDKATAFRIEGIPLFGRLVADAEVRERLAATGGDWRPWVPIHDFDDLRVGAVWRESGGDLFLPFDPNELIPNFWSERYVGIAGSRSLQGLKRWARGAYYRVRPLLPRRLQLRLRKGFTHVQRRTTFPRWPVEPALHDFFELLFGLVAEIATEPIPWLAPWPRGYDWALVLTHDVETQVGCDNVALLRDCEAERGYRSSWNFVPERYRVPDEVVDSLHERGFEVGVHGLRHDGRDLSPRTFRKRLPEMRRHAERWGAVGFRSPATQRSWALMSRLGFDYDTSYTDTAPFEPQAGGCCSWLPYFNGPIVELPITLPQDHNLFEILEQDDESIWVDKAEALRTRGGMALVLTHPDYMLSRERLSVYARFLDRFAGDPRVWKALPREVSSWWRGRAESRLVRASGGWRIEGPARDEAAVRVLEPSGAA